MDRNNTFLHTLSLMEVSAFEVTSVMYDRKMFNFTKNFNNLGHAIWTSSVKFVKIQSHKSKSHNKNWSFPSKNQHFEEIFLFRLLPDISHFLYDPLNQRNYIGFRPLTTILFCTHTKLPHTLPKMNEVKAEGNFSLSSDANKTFLRYNNHCVSI